MAKSKYAPALFEVIGGQEKRKQSSGRLALPTWWRGGKPESRGEVDSTPATPATGETTEPSAPPPTLPPEPVSEERPPVQEAIEDTVPPVRPLEVVRTEAPEDTGSGRLPWARVRSGRLEVSLNPINAAVVVGGLLLALLCSYMIGVSRGSSSDTPVQTQAKEETPNPEVMDLGSGRDAVRPDATSLPGPQPVQRVAGLQYVVVEGFKPEDRDAAVHAQEWLGRKGVDTTLERQKGTGRWLLVTVNGFEYSKEEEKRWMERIPALGREYRQAFAGEREIRYDFRSPLVMPWK